MRENRGRWIVTLTGATTTATLLLGQMVTTSGAVAPAARGGHDPVRPATASVAVSPVTSAARTGVRTSARWSGAVDTRSLAAVDNAYRTTYAPKLTLPVAWLGGSLLGCLAGLVSGTTNAGTLSSLNFVRSLAGLAPVSFSPTLNASAQKAALIMAANNSLDHHPSSNWKCWSPVGAASAGRSNLALAYPSLAAGEIIDLYMDDPGASNTAAGHRRWILNPFSTVMGSGSTNVSNALTVIGPSSSARPNPAWVGWPTAGYFPNKLEPGGRWSLSSGLRSVSFAKARVAVFAGATRIPVHRYRPHVGYGQPTLVWQMPPRFSRVGTYRVYVTNIKRAGVKKPMKTSYTVRLFTPSS